MLELRNLGLLRGGKTICENLSLEVEKGGTLIISGPNGSGKSSLVECLIGAEKPDGGHILLDGHDLRHLGRSEKKIFHQSTGIVLQQSLLRPYDTVRKTLTHEALTGEKISEMLSFLGFEESAHRLVRDLSFGQRRELDLVRSLAHDPSLVIWDEPFMSLDHSSQERFHSLLLKLRSSGSTLIIATIDPLPFQFLNPEKVLEL